MVRIWKIFHVPGNPAQAGCTSSPLDTGARKLKSSVYSKAKQLILFGTLLLVLGWTSQGLAVVPAQVKALYLPEHCFTDRKISDFIHYAKLADINAAVLHVKDPFGYIKWNSMNPLARQIEAVKSNGLLKHALNKLEKEGFWTIAKLDVFVDHQLVSQRPEMGIVNIQTSTPWIDQNGHHWANPYDRRVWDYNIALGKELAAMGFDEIQFDYIRFPSDGDLSVVDYPFKKNDMVRTQCIGAFLESAKAALKPLGLVISVDLFGMVAWKTDDFGVGQVIEAIAPNVDVICPMLYPSHFPPGFIGRKDPSDAPLEIMELSMKRLKERTDVTIRPWIQGFWYKPAEINAQIDGILKTGPAGWSVWNPGGNYQTTYKALAARLNTRFPAPQFYPSAAEICNNEDRVTRGRHRVVNFTDYREGYTIISLEESKGGVKSAYTNTIAVLDTIDEAIMDLILAQRDIPISRLTTKYSKKLRLANLLCEDLEIEPRRLRPRPIFIDWQNNCRFSLTIPPDCLEDYRTAMDSKDPQERDVYANVSDRENSR